ncbi:MAG: HEAT repeat domain-containing protein [Crocosphaera sp.]|nr:HEAT repeat domain-containing protein [Crocosphaera sp.]
MNNTDISPLLEKVETADSAESLLEAVETLANADDEASIPTLIKVLGYNNPGASVAAVEGLINLGDPAVPYLLEQIDGYNYGARAWATRALAGIGHPHALDLLIEAASGDFSLSVRRAAARGLGEIHWLKLCDEPIEKAQTRALTTLLEVLKDPEWVVRYAAIVGLEKLALSWGEAQAIALTDIEKVLKDLIKTESELAVALRAKWALRNLSFDEN